MDESIGGQIVALHKKEKQIILFVPHKYVGLCHISFLKKRRKKRESEQKQSKPKNTG